MVQGRVFRLSGPQEHWPLVEDLLRGQGFVFTPLPFYAGARLLEHEPLPLGASLAARFGRIYIQDASSMLPALALARLLKESAGTAILDICASPGGKSSLLAGLLGSGAMILANEPAPGRLAVLRRNPALLNIFNAATLGLPGESLPLPEESFDGVLLDPPCSAWGTADKHPRVLTLWRGGKLKPLIALQRRLLRAALRLLRPGGVLLYSTCTLNAQENEEQAHWAGEEILPLEPFPGFTFDPPAADAPGSLRVAGGGLGQGFYLAALRKSGAPGIAGEEVPRQAAFPRSPVMLSPSPLLDPGLLPPGQVQTLPGGLYFQHAVGERLLEGADTSERVPPWRGFFLGRPGAGGALLPGTAPGGLMPSPDKARREGAAILQAEDPSPLLALLSGRSLPGFAAREAGLYYKELPLARLKCRGGRVLL